MTHRPTNLNVERAIREQDNRLVSPIETLEDYAAEIATGDEAPSRLLILGLKENEDGTFELSHRASNLRASEMLALLEMAKVNVLAQMGMIP